MTMELDLIGFPGYCFFTMMENSTVKSKPCRSSAAVIERASEKEGPGMSKNKILLQWDAQGYEATYPGRLLIDITIHEAVAGIML